PRSLFSNLNLHLRPFFFLLLRLPPIFTLFPYTTLFRSPDCYEIDLASMKLLPTTSLRLLSLMRALRRGESQPWRRLSARAKCSQDRKSTRLNSSHVAISYAVFCLKKKKQHTAAPRARCQ